MRNGFIQKRGEVPMINSFYTAASGTIQMQKGMDVTANNIANVSTTGFQAQKGAFADLVYTNIHAAEGTDSDLVSGHGTKLAKTDTLFAASALENTSRSLDYALPEAYQFFAIRSGDTVKYTRNGNFHLSMQGNANYLVSSDGGYVLGANGQPIQVTDESAAAPVGVFTFSNCDGLQREAGTYFVETAASGQAQAVRDAEVRQGYLENSSVSLPDEMATILETQRAFQLNSKMVQISDEIMQTVNSLR